jgi:hypothetical protein
MTGSIWRKPNWRLSLQKWHHLAGMAALIAIVGFYNVLFAFSFFPITEGWFSAYAHLILDGKVPYRDFYFYLPPFYPMVFAAIVGLLGDSFMALRIIGVFIIITIAILLYKILAKRFSPSSSMVASIVACIYYQSGVAHIPYDFTQVLTLFTLAATWMLVQASVDILSQENLSWSHPVFRRMFLAGLFATFAFLTKQSNGAFVVVASWFGCFYLTLPWGRNSWRLIGAFGLGCLVPVMMMLIWLYQADALTAFWGQIFGGALEAKGSLSHVLFSWINGLLTAVFVKQMSAIGSMGIQIIAASFILTKLLAYINKPLAGKRSELILLASMALLCAAVIASSYMGTLVLSEKIREFGLQANNYIIPVTTTLSAAILILSVVSCFNQAVRKFLPTPVVILGIVSVGMIWGNGTSAGLSEVGVFTMLALALAIMMDTKLFRYVGFAIALIITISLINLFASRKFDVPYSWWGVAEPSVREATNLSKTPIARGLRISKPTAENIDALASSLAKGSRDGDIFAFPNIPLVYLIANQWPNSKVVVPWFDFLPDMPARAEASRLLGAPPATIVNLKLPSVAWEAHERLFREGKPLGQRSIQRVIDELTEKRKLYWLDFSREVSPGCVLEVWHRRVDEQL